MKDFFQKYKSFINYIGLGYIGVVLNIVLSILMMRMFDSALFGKISLGKSIFQSYEFSHLGTRFGLDRVLPHTKSLKKKSYLFASSFYFTLFCSLIFSLAWVLFDIKNVYFYSFFFIAGLFSSLSTLYRVFYRTYTDKSVFISISFWILIFPILSQILAIYFWGLTGLLYSNFLTYLIVFIFCSIKYRISLKISIKSFKYYLKKIFSIGFFLFLSSIISFLALVGDRFIIAKYWGFSLVGDYSVIMFFFVAFTTLSTSYTELIMNKIILNRDPSYIIKQVKVVFILSIIFTIVAIPILPFFIEFLIPKYMHLVFLMQLILLGGIIYSVMPILNYYLHAIDKRKELLAINVVSTLIYFIGLFIVLNNFHDLKYLIYLKIFSFFLILAMTSYYFFKSKKSVSQ